MLPYSAIFAIALLAALAALVTMVMSRQRIGNAKLAGLLGIAFLLFTCITLAVGGVWPFWTNHTSNLAGVQVWIDLLVSVAIAFFFIAPRARRVGMSVGLWAFAVAMTAGIGLLAMSARLFWLEQEAERADIR